MTAPRIEMQRITKRFGSTIANDAIDFEIEPGEIHALLGENGAGKTTLMNVLYGIHRPEGGAILIDGREAEIRSPRDAIALGVGMVHQHFMLVPTLTVVENCSIGRDPLTQRFMAAPIEADMEVIAERYGLRVDPNSVVEDLSVGLQQRVEIIRALARGVQVLILDEPTAVLTPQEVDELLAGLRTLVDEGKSIVFITHKLREVMAVSSRVTVLRRGRHIKTLPTAETTERELALLMVGKPELPQVQRTDREPGNVALEVQRLDVLDDRRQRAVRDLSFALRAGEILGVAGVDGNGQAELAQALCGLRPFARGELILAGERFTGRSPSRLIRAGLAHIPDDRQRWGLFADFTVAENLVSDRHSWRPFALLGFLAPRAIATHAMRLIKDFDIRPPEKDAPVHSLSGGNRQKVIVARSLARQPDVLVVSQPTRGLDVAATESIRQQILAERDRGAAVLLISADLDEVMALSDRIAVMYEGRFMDVLDGDGADVERIGMLMAGVSVAASA